MFEKYPDVVTVDQLGEMLGVCSKTAYNGTTNVEISTYFR